MGESIAFYVPREPPLARSEVILDAVGRAMEEERITFGMAEFQVHPTPIFVPWNPEGAGCPSCNASLYDRVLALITEGEVIFEEGTVEQPILACRACGWKGSLRDLDTDDGQFAVTSCYLALWDVVEEEHTEMFRRRVEATLGRCKVIFARDL